MKRFTALGVSDDRTVCDCCGKSNLKRTIVLRRLSDELVVYYGVNCAADALSVGRKYAAKDAACLVADVQARDTRHDELARELAAQTAQAQKHANDYKESMTVFRYRHNGRIHYGSLSTRNFISDNKYGYDSVATLEPLTNPT